MYTSKLKIKTSSATLKGVSADGRISQTDNQFHITGPATEKARGP